MYINAGYLNNSRLDFKDYSAPLIVGSCGTYRLKTRKRLPTYWQKGRRDYQILYVANGKAHFWFDGVEQVVSAGNMVLYKPDEIQKYVYYLEDHPEVFWIHFTGNDVKNILTYLQNPVSLETPVGETGEDSLGDMVEDRTERTPEEAMEQIVQKEEVSELLETLNERERQVIRLRYGLDGGRTHTLEEIGEQLNVTRERVRQIEARALEKLRTNAEK